MALIVETGAASATAESYNSVAELDTYHLNRGNTAWAALATLAKEQAARNATDFMAQNFASRWNGYRYTTAQALDWPRSMAPIPGGFGVSYYATTDIPAAVKYAHAELALRASAGPLTDDTGQEVIREKVGSLEVEYQPGSKAGAQFPAVTRLLAPLLSGAGGVRLSKS